MPDTNVAGNGLNIVGEPPSGRLEDGQDFSHDRIRLSRLHSRPQ